MIQTIEPTRARACPRCMAVAIQSWLADRRERLTLQVFDVAEDDGWPALQGIVGSAVAGDWNPVGEAPLRDAARLVSRIEAMDCDGQGAEKCIILRGLIRQGARQLIGRELLELARGLRSLQRALGVMPRA